MDDIERLATLFAQVNEAEKRLHVLLQDVKLAHRQLTDQVVRAERLIGDYAEEKMVEAAEGHGKKIVDSINAAIEDHAEFAASTLMNMFKRNMIAELDLRARGGGIPAAFRKPKA